MANADAALAALGALSDPVRREVLLRLSRAPVSVGEIARGLPVSRPAVSQHLAVLKSAELVLCARDGTRNIYRIDPRGIGAIRAWLDSLWADALGEFAAFAEKDSGT